MPSLRRGVQQFSVIALCACSHSCTVDPGPSCVGDAPANGIGAYSSQQLARLNEASLVFAGTVQELHASTIPSADTAMTVIATIDTQVFAGPEVEQLHDTWGDRVTVKLARFDLAVGDHVLLATWLLEYGGQLEVLELDRIDPAAFPHYAADAPRIRQLFIANPLYARVATSARIATEHVDKVVDAPSSGGGSEHSPLWRIATGPSDAVLCGPEVATVDDGFASSQDIAWSSAPKLAVGQDALLLQHHDILGFDQPPDLITTQALDVHPLADRPQIEGLLASPPQLR
jgi:hypothetical protein